jgi:hypothetical protein
MQPALEQAFGDLGVQSPATIDITGLRLITQSRHDEGPPKVMPEAIAAGLRVLASDLLAHRNMVQHRQTGWLAVNGDKLCQGLDWLDDPAYNLATGQAARQWIRDSLGTWDDCAGRCLLERKA